MTQEIEKILQKAPLRRPTDALDRRIEALEQMQTQAGDPDAAQTQADRAGRERPFAGGLVQRRATVSLCSMSVP